MRLLLRSPLKPAILALILLAAASTLLAVPATQPTPILTLLNPKPAPEMETATGLHGTVPANFYRFGPVQEGKSREAQEIKIEELALSFKAFTTITSVKITAPDFKLLEGGTCVEGHQYFPNESCTVRVAFTPKGPGNRLGKLTVAHTASPHPESIGLGGLNYAPAISFVPSIINTVPPTYNATAKKGLLAYAYSLAIDGGDNLYIADLGSQTQSPEIDVIDSSGNMTDYAGGGTDFPGDGDYAPNAELIDPNGIAADAYGSLFIADYEGARLRQVDLDQIISTVAGGGNTCTMLPCAASSYSLEGVTGVVTNAEEDIYISMFGTSQELLLSEGGLYVYGSDPDGDDQPLSLAIDSNNRLFYSSFGYCQVRSVDPSTHYISIVAGTRSCGFSGDGGQARGAELNYEPRQISVDAANNLYVADENNQVIRRIDASTGVIHTIAGTPGKSGFTGNGGPATIATFSNPYGVAVDSNGSVYVADQVNGVVRKIGPIGNLIFSAVVTTPSAVQTITVSNTGNSTLNIAQVYWSGANTADFSIDAHSTTCTFLTSGIGTLAIGQTCTIGVIFKPSLVAAESTTLNFVDNTGLGLNTIQLNGSGLKKSPTITWPKPASITTSTALSSTQLDATATYAGVAVPGTFVYNPAAGATLTAGTHTLSTTFTPTSTALYNTITTSTSITVTAAAVKPKPTLSLTTSKNPANTLAPVNFVAVIAPVEGLAPSGSIHFYDHSTSLGTMPIRDSQASLQVRGLAPGTHTITAVYSGDTHFAASASQPLLENIAK